MAGAGGVSQAGGFTKGLFESVGETLLRANHRTVAGSGTASVC